MADVAYVLIERGFEYNDCGYDVSEFGKPKKVYLTREKAEKAVVEESLQRYLLPGHSPFYYFNTWESNHIKFREFLKEHYPEEDPEKIEDRSRLDIWDIPTNSTKAQLEALLKYIHRFYGPFYCVEKVPVAE